MAKALLTAAEVKALAKPGKHNCGGGCYLQIAPSGSRSWLVRYERDGRDRWLGLGSAGLVTLAEAREKARQIRRRLIEGGDPLAEKRAARARARLDAATAVTFRDAAERLMAAKDAGLRNARHRAQWRSTLATYAYPVFGDLPVAAVDTALVEKALAPIWTAKAETASRLRGRIEAVLDYAKVLGLRGGENPARWKGHLDNILPSPRKVKPVRHHAAMPYADVSAFMAELRARESVSARALEFLILTAARTGEVIGARWSEIAGEVWTIPADRMKGGAAHRVPLPPRALEILATIPRESGSEFIFMGGRAGRPLSNMAMLEFMRGTRAGFTVHGFRSAFRDWCAEETSTPNHVAEAALAHKVSNAVEAAYRRGDLFDKRRDLMLAWSRYLATPPAAEGGNIVKMSAR